MLNEHDQAVAPTMETLWATVAAADEGGMAHACEQVNVEEEETNIEWLLSRCQASLQLNDDDELARFVATAELAIANACNFVRTRSRSEVRCQPMRKLARRPTSADRLRVHDKL